MATPSGLGGQWGYVSEVTVGTAVTVTKFLPIRSEEIGQEIERLDSEGIRAGRLVTAAWKAGQKTISGTVESDLWNTDVAVLFKHMFGTVATTGVGPFTHTYTPGDLTGKSMTIQAGRPDTTGTVQPFTWAGCKVGSWTLSATVGEICTMSLDVVGMTETTATALATASYAAALAPFCFTTASVKIAAVTVATVKDIELTGDNGLTDRVRLGSATSKEYLQNGFREYSGSMNTDFESLTAYNRFVSGTEAALELKFDNGTQTLTITCNVRFDGESPGLSGPELLEQPLPFKCVSGTSDATAITAVLVNSESSAV